MIKGKPCTICKEPDDYSDETICHNCIAKWKKILEWKERKRIVKEIDKSKKFSSHTKMKFLNTFFPGWIDYVSEKKGDGKK